MNFPEGTRFSNQKHQTTASPFKYLLKPKAGGIANVLTSMYEKLDCIIDVTIIYPENKMGFLDFISGQIHQIKIIINKIEISKEMTGDYQNNENYKKRFQDWLNNLWENKDRIIEKELV